MGEMIVRSEVGVNLVIKEWDFARTGDFPTTWARLPRTITPNG